MPRLLSKLAILALVWFLFAPLAVSSARSQIHPGRYAESVYSMLRNQRSPSTEQHADTVVQSASSPPTSAKEQAVADAGGAMVEQAYSCNGRALTAYIPIASVETTASTNRTTSIGA